MITDRKVKPALRINQVIACYPATVGTFGEWGMDGCCGGSHTLEEASARHGLDLDVVLHRLNAVAAADPAA